MSNDEFQVIMGELASTVGDADTTSLATSGVAELLKSVGATVATKQAADQKAAADKANAANVQAAQDARTAAQLAQMSAASETDPNGPMHRAALQADMAARVLEQKAGMMSAGMVSPGANKGIKPTSGGGSFLTKQAGGMPVWTWGLLTVTVIAGIVTVAKLAGGPKAAGARR